MILDLEIPKLKSLNSLVSLRSNHYLIRFCTDFFTKFQRD